MIQLSWSISLLLFFTLNSVFGGDGSVSSVFSSLRRTDTGTKTYHFSSVTKYERVNEPIIYADGYNDNSKMIVGFNNLVVFGKFENEKHYVIRVNEDLDEDTANIPSQFLSVDDSGELFDVVTLKPTTTTTTTTAFPLFRDMIRNIQRETLPAFDPDKQSLKDYLVEVGMNASKSAQKVDSNY